MEVHVLNPSSRTDTGITEMLADSLAWLSGPALPTIRCVTLEDGPNGISTVRDSDEAAPAVFRYVERTTEAEGFVVACFSDPGVLGARQLSGKPVIGIGEAGFAQAIALGDRIGTISVSKGGARKVGRQARHLGLSLRHVAHRDLGLDYGDLQHRDRVIDSLTAHARDMVAREGVDVILLAGAGMAASIAEVQRATGLPIVDPTQAAVSMLVSQLMLGR